MVPAAERGDEQYYFWSRPCATAACGPLPPRAEPLVELPLPVQREPVALGLLAGAVVLLLLIVVAVRVVPVASARAAAARPAGVRADRRFASPAAPPNRHDRVESASAAASGGGGEQSGPRARPVSEAHAALSAVARSAWWASVRPRMRGQRGLPSRGLAGFPPRRLWRAAFLQAPQVIVDHPNDEHIVATASDLLYWWWTRPAPAWPWPSGLRPYSSPAHIDTCANSIWGPGPGDPEPTVL